MRWWTLLTMGVLVIAGAIYITACSKPSEVYASEAVIQVPTLQCDMCVNTVTEALKGINGVQTTTIDLEQKTATVTYNSNETSEMELIMAISKVGYQANDQQADSLAYAQLPSCCKVKP